MEEELAGYVYCKYAEMTKFGLFCPHSGRIQAIKGKFPCPDDSGTDGKRNGVCYGFAKFIKKEDR